MSSTPAAAYADILVGIFSLAAINHEHLNTPFKDFHRLLVALRKEFPNQMPSFDEVGRAPFQHSELLGDALHLSQCSDRITLNDRKDIVVTQQMAMRNMQTFDAFSRRRFISNFSRIADRLVAIIRAGDDGPFPSGS